MFEMVMVACQGYGWTIHGGRTGFIGSTWNYIKKKYYTNNFITNYVAPVYWRQEFAAQAENQVHSFLFTFVFG